MLEEKELFECRAALTAERGKRSKFNGVAFEMGVRIRFYEREQKYLFSKDAYTYLLLYDCLICHYGEAFSRSM